MAANIPECPPSLKAIQHYLKTATEHDARDPIVSYWCRLHALQTGLKLTTKKTPEETKVLMGIMDWLEEAKKIYKDNEAISTEVVAQAHLENYALRLFMFADKQDREQSYGKNVVKAFYTAGVIYDVLTIFGDLTDEAAQNRKYARWKAAYIHNCLKNGETPVPGPMQDPEGSQDDGSATGTVQPGSSDSQPFGYTQPGATDSQSFGYTQPGSTYSQTFGNAQPSSTDSQTFGFTNVTPASPPTIPTSFNNSLPDPNLAMRAASQLPPVPYTPDPNPGGFVPYDPSQQPQPVPLTTHYGDNSSSVAELSPEQIQKAQKYCKWASSALNYDDIKTAITNLKNALELLQTGRDPA